MKILDKNEKSEKLKFRGTCKHCSSIIEADRSEMRFFSYDEKKGTEYSYGYCPACRCHGSVTFYPYPLIYNPKKSFFRQFRHSMLKKLIKSNNEKWKPTQGEKYWYLNFCTNSVEMKKNKCTDRDNERLFYGNCFRTNLECIQWSVKHGLLDI